MQRTFTILGTLLVMVVASAGADDRAELIALDKQWGEEGVKGQTTVAAKLLADGLVSMNEKGVTGKQGELAEAELAPAGTRYQPTNYKVTFINPDTAIMTHGTKGKDAHYSLHVWSRQGDSWQVVATAVTPAAAK